jgi:hypothetical protein
VQAHAPVQPLSVGTTPPPQVAMHAPEPQFTCVPVQSSPVPHSMEHEPLPQLKLTSPQASVPPTHRRLQANVSGHVMVAVSHASAPSQMT